MHNLFLVYLIKIYMFRAYLGPSSGGTTVCMQQLVLIILFRRLSVFLVGFSLHDYIDKHGHQNIKKNEIFSSHDYIDMHGHQNIKKNEIFYLHDYIDMHGHQNIKKNEIFYSHDYIDMHGQ